MSFLKNLITLISMLIVSGHTYGQAAVEIDLTSNPNWYLKVEPLYANGEIFTPTEEMASQLLNGGCIPRGTLISDSAFNLHFQLLLTEIAPESELKVRFKVCDDPLALSLPNAMRLRFAVGGAVYSVEDNQKVSKRNNLNVELKTPSGALAPMSQFLVNTSGHTHGVYRTIGTSTYNYHPIYRYLDTNESGVFELVIKNPSKIKLKTAMQLNILGTTVP